MAKKSKGRRLPPKQKRQRAPQQIVDEAEASMLVEVLRRQVVSELARWLDSALRTLKETFEFDEAQLTEFAREFRRRIDESKPS